MKRILFVLLLLPLLFSQCKKDDDSSEFTVTGVRDVNMNIAESTKLSLTVAQVSGPRQPVALSVTGVPYGIKISVDQNSGLPDYASNIGFVYNYSIPTGTYPLMIIASSPTFTRKYKLNLVVPELEHFISLGADKQPVTDMGRMDIPKGTLVTGYNLASGISCGLLFPTGHFPTVSGSYKIVKEPVGNDEVCVYARKSIESGSRSTGHDNKYAQVTVQNGKIAFSFSEVEVEDDGSGGITTASAFVAE